MKDFLGQELRIGDNITCINPSRYGGPILENTKIKSFKKVMVLTDKGLKYPEKIIKIDTILNNLENGKQI